MARRGKLAIKKGPRSAGHTRNKAARKRFSKAKGVQKFTSKA